MRNSTEFNYESLIDLAEILSQIGDYEELLRIVNEKSSELFEVDQTSIMMLNPATHQTIKTVIKGKVGEEKEHILNVQISGWVIKNDKSFLSNNLETENRIKSFSKDHSFNKAVCTPIKIGGNIIGTLLLLNIDSKEDFLPADLEFAKKFSTIISPYLYDSQSISDYFTCQLEDDELISKYNNIGLLGRSRKFVSLLKAMDAASKCHVRVLLKGETGTGKELISKAIHKFSPRYNKKFIVVDCGAIPSNLIESELFGHLKGAFTGAVSDRKGLVEEADGGTLFIDEINLLPLELQSKLFRLIQEGEFRPLGSNELKKVDVRFITASSASLAKLVKEKSFREELYYRLNVYPIDVPSLNERSKDIPVLVDSFINKFAAEQNKNNETVGDDVMLYLTNRLWKGNVRELENFIERIVTLADASEKIITKKILPDENKKEMKKLSSGSKDFIPERSLDELLSDYESIMIRKMLVANDWNQTNAAKSLQIKEQTLRYKMNKYGIANPKK